MRCEVTDQIRATAWNGLAPVAGVLAKLFFLRRVDVIADETGQHNVLHSSVGIELWHIAPHECFGYGRSMKEGPNIALIGSLIGDPARANMLTALMSGKALTVSELAEEAGVTIQTASSHLSKLGEGGLLRPRKQGRHKYFALADEEVGRALSPRLSQSWHLASRAWVEQELPKTGDWDLSVVVTHHLPHPRSVSERFKDSPLNPAFASDLSELVEGCGAALWVHGHTHDSCDYQAGATRVVCNPKGYGPKGEGAPIENRAFDPMFVVEV